MNFDEEKYKAHILEVMERFAKGEASEVDKQELDNWYNHFPSFERYAEGMPSSEKLLAKDKMLHNINKQIYLEAVPVKQSQSNRMLRRVMWAAMIAIISCSGLLFYRSEIKRANTKQLTQNQVIIPGGNRAFLTLADGSRISLTDAANGNIAKQAGVTISKTTNGQLIYTAHHVQGNTVEKNDGYNTIETPSGGQYQLQLPDGTVVWLNAASSLKYPVSFSKKKQRHVQLKGEAYFEVAKNKSLPFVVSVHSVNGDKKEQDVEVLGTHFNINAYHDDNTIKTTLLEGSIKVSLPSASTIQLSPGQQSVNKNNALQVTEVNAEYAVAWKDGYFRFNDKTLGMAMKEIARWYNVDVQYKDPALRNEPLAGTISKYSSITQVLKKMELTGAFRFTVKSREIIVE
ncbi:FecR family protein [Pedobacter montanisoli]|uniref:DUF4974 domain-containing protein n=1 Tax=Pedobacter montanisoli TaxID=2923277 RepID=A0ABS9ZUQ0_9SPHI|nr:FecR domain-containing protein [Pedobacter montanisoli]MCJ0742320.1 DUF4974 domain-containing protein [Pedobacter montanisoli]